MRVLAGDVLCIAAAEGSPVQLHGGAEDHVGALAPELAPDGARDLPDEGLVPRRGQGEERGPASGAARLAGVRGAEAVARVLHLQRRHAEPGHGLRGAGVVAGRGAAPQHVEVLPAQQPVPLLGRHLGQRRRRHRPRAIQGARLGESLGPRRAIGADAAVRPASGLQQVHGLACDVVEVEARALGGGGHAGRGAERRRQEMPKGCSVDMKHGASAKALAAPLPQATRPVPTP
mmetsp:Transcript_60513/g.169604  ORF Transcript_60513/g.169604 Transcript_60513/m.169604 type:complete len:232 (+) Transcript_60513:1981-2676(+)